MKKMLQAFHVSEKLFRRNVLLISVYVSAMGFVIYQRTEKILSYISFNNMRFFFTAIQEEQGKSVIYFILFLFLSFEFLYSLRGAHLIETAKTIPSAKPKTYMGQILVLMVLAFLTTIVHFSFDMVFYNMAPTQEGAVLLHIVQMNILNIFLVCLVAVLIGGLLSIVLNRYVGYTALIAVVFLVTPLSNSFIRGFLIENSSMYKIKDFFSFMPININYDSFVAGGSIESARWNVLFFWICFLAALFLLILYKKTAKKAIALCLCGALLLTSGYQFQQFITAGDLLAFDHDSKNTPNVFHIMHPGKDNPAEFTVTGYKMDLDLTRLLDASCTVYIEDNKNLSAYDFTLSFSYQLRSITDKKGNALPYTRDGDYLTVENTTGSALSELHLSYYGNSIDFGVNNQQIILPGYHPFYPFAGFKDLFVSNGLQGYRTDTVDRTIKDFDVGIKACVPFVTGLKQDETGRYRGSSQTISILGGLVEPMTYEDIRTVRVLYASFMFDATDVSWVTGIDQELESLYNYFDVPEDNRIKTEGKLIIPPGIFPSQGGSGNSISFEDHILFAGTDYRLSAKLCAVSLLSNAFVSDAKKDVFKNIFLTEFLLDANNLFNMTYATIEQALKEASEAQKPRLITGNLFYQLVQKIGDKQAAIMAYRYLCNGSDTRTPQQFLEAALAE